MTERISLDLTGSEDATKAGTGDFAPLPKGWYKAVVYEAETKFTAQAKGANPYLKARINITEEGDYYKRVVFDNFIALYVTEKAPFLAAKAEQLSRIAGIWDGEDRSAVVLPNDEDIAGLEVEVLVGQERDEYAEGRYEDEHGETHPDAPLFRNVVKAYRPRGGWPKPGETVGKAKGNTSITL